MTRTPTGGPYRRPTVRAASRGKGTSRTHEAVLVLETALSNVDRGSGLGFAIGLTQVHMGPQAYINKHKIKVLFEITVAVLTTVVPYI